MNADNTPFLRRTSVARTFSFLSSHSDVSSSVVEVSLSGSSALSSASSTLSLSIVGSLSSPSSISAMKGSGVFDVFSVPDGTPLTSSMCTITAVWLSRLRDVAIVSTLTLLSSSPVFSEKLKRILSSSICSNIPSVHI